MKLSKILFFLLLTNTLLAQKVRISDGTIIKQFPESSYYELEFGDFDENGKICCNYAVVTGHIRAISPDSIGMILDSYTNYEYPDSFSVQQAIVFKTPSRYQTFAKTDLLSLQRFKNPKHKKRRGSWQIIGGMLMVAGVITAANYFVVGKSENRNNLLIAGGIQFGLGVGLMSTRGSKRYRFKRQQQNWAFVD